MNDDYDAHGRDEKKKPEASLKDALMPEKPTPPADDRSLRRDTYGETPSLQDALLPKDHKPTPVAGPEPAPETKVSKPVEAAAPAAKKPVAVAEKSSMVTQAIVALSVVLGFVVIFFVGRMSGAPAPEDRSPSPAVATDTPSSAAVPIDPTPTPAPTPTIDWGDPGPMNMAMIQEQGRIIDVHEHIESLAEAPKFLAAMDALGIQKMCLMGSSRFTLTLNEQLGFTGYDENNEELIKIVDAYPGRFEAWPTINPEDPDALSKIQDLVSRGATGVKLYIGHGYVGKNQQYMFHTIAMDDPTLLPFYAWCSDERIPLVFHVNPHKSKKGFAQEFIAVLTRYPDLKVIAPHFILSSVQSYRLEELLDTFPNLYSDVSFGDYFMKERLGYISKFPDKFRTILKSYPNRFMFAADLVMIAGRADDWAPIQLQAYLDMLSKETYTSTAIPGETLNGLALSDELLSRVLFRNYLEFRIQQPTGTQLTREIDWSRMNVEPIDREPGEAFPPPLKTR